MKKPTPAKEILEAIKEEAIRIWGKNWFAELVRAYCEVEGEVTGTVPTPKARRSQLERAKAVAWMHKTQQASTSAINQSDHTLP